MRKLLVLGLILIPLIVLIVPVRLSRADELEDVTNELNQEKQRLADLEAKKDQLANSISSAYFSLAQVSAQLDEAEAELEAIEEALAKKEELLAKWESHRNLLIKDLYKRSRTSPIEVALSSDGFASSARQLYYYEENIGLLVEQITLLNGEISVFRENKAQAEQLRNELADLRSQYQAALAARQAAYSSVMSRLAEVKVSIQNLTAKQEQLILAKIGSSLATGDLVLADDPNARVTFDPGFSPAFAAFSFGAYTHRNGMSQYGARGRANSGQSAEQILAAYYPGETLNKNYPVPSTIRVHGTNEYGQTFNCEVYSFNDYIKHLYEVPSSWPTAVLRAQAVAARSYAIRYISTTSNRCDGQPYICPSQHCQVVKKEINAPSWQAAVDDTATWVLSGGPGNFQYSASSGGYLNTSGWDTTSGDMSSWPDDAYENIGLSPWFYKGWYKNLSGETCGRSHPWLTEAEFADILNSWVVYTRGNDDDRSRVAPVDTACWGGNPYSISEMKSRAEALGGAYTHVHGVAVSYSPDGYTSLISLVTDRGTLTIDGQIFKDIFNIRAPGYLAIKTPLYNIEKK